MEAFFMEIGVEDVCARAMTKETWDKIVSEVQKWENEQQDADLASITGEEAVKLEALHPEEKDRRKRVRELVQRAKKAYAALFKALPLELQPQVAHIPSGFAYGLWKWLQDKYQSTQTDAVNTLIQTWMKLRMEENESFDSYRARVNSVYTLLVAADEKPSARVYAYKLLDELTPRFNQAVLALKASGKLNVTVTVNPQTKVKTETGPNWDEIAAFINAHEREVLRKGRSSSFSQACMA